MSEIWRPVPGYAGLYEVSNEGRVRSLDRKIDRPHPRNSLARQVRTVPGRILRATPNDQGYPRVVLTKAGAPRHRKVHQLVAIAFLGPKPKGKIVRHKNGRRDECWAENLTYGSHRQNAADSKRHGLMPLGSRRAQSKLDERAAAIIRALRGRVSTNALADRFQVSGSAVSAIHLRRTWTHVPRMPTAEARRLFAEQGAH